MKSAYSVVSLGTAAALAAILGSTPALTRAAQTDLAQTPLGTSATATVLPNLMYILDDSGSMNWDYMPDNVQRPSNTATPVENCKRCKDNDAASCEIADVICSDGHDGKNPVSTISTWGEPPFRAAQFNQIFYNPDITYAPGVDYLGNSLGNQPATAAKNDAYNLIPGTQNLVTSYTDIYYCLDTVTASSFAAGARTNTASCRRNGINNIGPAPRNYFLYWSNNVTNTTVPFGGYPVATGAAPPSPPPPPPPPPPVVSAPPSPLAALLSRLLRPFVSEAFAQVVANTSFRVRFVHPGGNPHYFKISPHEYCSDPNLINCRLANANGSAPAGFTIPAPIRYCKKDDDAASTAVMSDAATSANPKCRATFDADYEFPRYGRFTRVDIVPATATYPKSATSQRTDCAAATTCTYAEELQNFANWYSYYRTRTTLMKTASGRVFAGLDDRYRIGFLTLNAADSTKYLKIDKFVSTHKSDWFTKFYSQVPSGGTQLREALSRVGRHYAGRTDGINSIMATGGIPDDPVQFSCQQNFSLLTTDGYWNGAAGQRIDGTAIANQDNVVDKVAPFYVTRPSGTFDGNLAGTAGTGSGSSDTLADVAMYYYKTDLRPTGPVSKDNVPTSTKDIAPHQHMVTFTLGLGLNGLMTYRPDYETATTGDFAKIKAGNPSGCSWTTGACNWPQVQENLPSALDDLWHAAVNGRGVYFSAKDPNSLQSGLATTLSSIKILTGAAAASATSTPNITPTDNFIYSSTYRTVKWDGEVVAERIDAASGDVSPGVVWAAGGQLDARVTTTSDTRTIYTLDPSDATDKLKPFLYANLNATEQAHFDNKCIPADLPQCGSMSVGNLVQANKGSNLVPWLRGQTGNEGTLYRDREHVLGDVVNAKPAFVGKPSLLYGDAVVPDYDSFKTANASRQGVLYIPANDGMLHAFNADTGAEMWAYVPRMVMPDLYKLAGNNYDIKHRYYVDGSPTAMDVFFASTSTWKTILVGGLNAGGRGYYALDVTNPNTPKGLWEVCADPTGTLQCTDKDDNIGFTYGQPIITKDAKDGKWVVIVTSGYNNAGPSASDGDGKGYIYIIDVETGLIKDKKDTGVGDTTTPSGFARITGFATNFTVNNTTPTLYGGDLLGNAFSFDVENRQFQLIGQARDASGKMQSITTRPDVTRFDTPAPAFNVVYFGTGRLLGGTDIPDPATLVPPVLDLAYQQTVYGFRDTGANLGNLRAPGAKLVQQTLSVIDATSRTISNNPVDWSTQNGWWVDLNPASDSPGERVSIDPQLVKGVLLVATNEPNSDACSSGGDSFFYQFDYRSGSYVASAPGAVVGIKLGSALAAGFVVYRLPSGQLKYTGIDVTGKKQTGGVNPGAGGAVGSRASWRELYQ